MKTKHETYTPRALAQKQKNKTWAKQKADKWRRAQAWAYNPAAQTKFEEKNENDTMIQE